MSGVMLHSFYTIARLLRSLDVRPSNCNGVPLYMHLWFVAVVVGLVLVTDLLVSVGWLAVIIRLADGGLTDVLA